MADQIHKVIENAVIFSDNVHDGSNADLSFKYAASVVRIDGKLYPVLLSIKVGKVGEHVMYHLDGFEMRGRPVGFDTRGSQQRDDAASVTPTLITDRPTDSAVTLVEIYDTFKDYAANKERPLFQRAVADVRGSIRMSIDAVRQCRECRID